MLTFSVICNGERLACFVVASETFSFTIMHDSFVIIHDSFMIIHDSFMIIHEPFMIYFFLIDLSTKRIIGQNITQNTAKSNTFVKSLSQYGIKHKTLDDFDRLLNLSKYLCLLCIRWD